VTQSSKQKREDPQLQAVRGGGERGSDIWPNHTAVCKEEKGKKKKKKEEIGGRRIKSPKKIQKKQKKKGGEEKKGGKREISFTNHRSRWRKGRGGRLQNSRGKGKESPPNYNIGKKSEEGKRGTQRGLEGGGGGGEKDVFVADLKISKKKEKSPVAP